MIKDIQKRIGIDKRGTITSGEKNERGLPVSLSYFNLQPFPELIEAYGDKPTKLILFFPSDKIEDFFDCNYVRYSSTQERIRVCDGEECTHRIAEEIDGKNYEAGEISECVCAELTPDHKKRCRYVMYLKAYIFDIKKEMVNNPLCYMFHTTSKNSGDRIYSEIEKVLSLNMGVLKNVPFILSVEMITGKTNAKQKFPVWDLQAYGMVSDFKNRQQMILSAAKDKILLGDDAAAASVYMQKIEKNINGKFPVIPIFNQTPPVKIEDAATAASNVQNNLNKFVSSFDPSLFETEEFYTDNIKTATSAKALDTFINEQRKNIQMLPQNMQDNIEKAYMLRVNDFTRKK